MTLKKNVCLEKREGTQAQQGDAELVQFSTQQCPLLGNDRTAGSGSSEKAEGKSLKARWKDRVFIICVLYYLTHSEFSMVSVIKFSLSLWGSLSSEQTSITSWSMETPNERIWIIVTPNHLFKALLSKHVLYVLIIWGMYLCLYLRAFLLNMEYAWSPSGCFIINNEDCEDDT